MRSLASARSKALIGTVALLLAMAPRVQAGATATPQALDRIAQAALTRHHLPGLAIVGVQEGRVVYAKGFGHRALGAGRRRSGRCRHATAPTQHPSDSH